MKMGLSSPSFAEIEKDSEKPCNGFGIKVAVKTKFSHPLIFLSLVFLVIFLLAQLSSLLFETTAFFDLFRERMKNP